MIGDRAWWKEAVVYQVYPRSFNDADGDGNGDLRGIVEKLDYIADLGVDVIWLNPVYESPLADNGYDIADYRSIHEDFGTMADWEALRDGIHDRDMRLIMDLAVNHTSDDHRWFQRSRRGDEEYRDYYIWADGEPDEPPNNWTSGFGGSAWTYDEEREAYYLHLFDERQPDLNWANPAVREAAADVCRWWLEKGVDGFRLDVINLISKPDSLPDGDPSNEWVGLEHFGNGPRLEAYLRELESVFEEYDAMTVGETVGVDVETAGTFVGPDGPLDMVFHFEHVTLDYGEGGWWNVREWDLGELKEVFTRWQTDLEGWNTPYFGNHDQPRSVSRFGDDGTYRRESATMLATLLLTLRGTPFIYQGEEIGMTNYPFESLEEIRDVDTLNRIEERIAAGEIEGFDEVRDVVRYRSRDNARTPMQWSGDPHAGFTDGDPWIKVNPNYEDINVAAARADPDSVLQYYRNLIDLRADHDVLVYGDYELRLPEHSSVYAYERSLADERVAVLLNFAPDEEPIDTTTALGGTPGERLIGNYDPREALDGGLTLRPYEAVVCRLG